MANDTVIISVIGGSLTTSDRSLETSVIQPVSINHGYVYAAMMFIISRIILLNYRGKSRRD